VDAAPKAPATRRILAAARTLLARGGTAEISMGDVAAAAGVSKALVHYHFRDKDSLLTALVDDVGFATLKRAQDAVHRAGDGHALDELWAWLNEELQVGDVRVLLSLGEYDSHRVRAACRRVAAQRRDLMAEHATQVFDRLGLRLRVPAELVADTIVAFIDGLAVAHALEPDRAPRPAFDVLWLALLTLAE
jgi:AcrR family transcriptional regulator